MEVTERAVRALSRYQHSWAAFLDPADPTKVRLLGTSKDIEATVFEQIPVFPSQGDAMLDEIFAGKRVVIVLDAPTDPAPTRPSWRKFTTAPSSTFR